jgi:DNA-binding CsgD family transcriptional regulator
MRQLSNDGRMNETREFDGTLRILLGVVLVGTVVGGGIDLWLDGPLDWRSAHAIYEVALIVAASATSIVFWKGWWGSRVGLNEARQLLATRSRERDEWRASAEAALAGLGRAIDERFTAWGLTPAEREVALLLLKGLSHKQIAFATGRSERTVRQHAVAVYDKSKLGGRAELAAFFLEDLMLPVSADESDSGPRDERDAPGLLTNGNGGGHAEGLRVDR